MMDLPSILALRPANGVPRETAPSPFLAAAFLLPQRAPRRPPCRRRHRPRPILSTSPPSPDPRVASSPGVSTPRDPPRSCRRSVVEFALVSNSPPTAGFQGVTNSDLAFSGHYAFQGNYNGIRSGHREREETHAQDVVPLPGFATMCRSISTCSLCPRRPNRRKDCGSQGVPDTVSHDACAASACLTLPTLEAEIPDNVQTCRGSHTHTVVSDPKDPANIYIYISGSSRVRPEGDPRAAPTCTRGQPGSARVPHRGVKVPARQSAAGEPGQCAAHLPGLTAPPRSVTRSVQDSIETGCAPTGRTPGAPTRIVDGVWSRRILGSASRTSGRPPGTDPVP